MRCLASLSWFACKFWSRRYHCMIIVASETYVYGNCYCSRFDSFSLFSRSLSISTIILLFLRRDHGEFFFSLQSTFSSFSYSPRDLHNASTKSDIERAPHGIQEITLSETQRMRWESQCLGVRAAAIRKLFSFYDENSKTHLCFGCVFILVKLNLFFFHSFQFSLNEFWIY